MTRQELIEKLQETSPDRVKAYLDILDRAFLQVIISKFLSGEEIKSVLKHWQNQIKIEIDFESSTRNDFLMGTPAGRALALTSETEDGESLRLNSIDAMEVAKEIAKHNYLFE